MACEAKLRADINEIGWKVFREYTPSPQSAHTFSVGAVYFLFKQEDEAVERNVVLGLLNAFLQLIWRHGTVEVLQAGVQQGKEVVARFMLTFPGV